MAGLDREDMGALESPPSTSIILLFLVSSEEVMKTSAGLFALFLVGVHRNLQATWVLTSGIALNGCSRPWSDLFSWSGICSSTGAEFFLKLCFP